MIDLKYYERVLQKYKVLICIKLNVKYNFFMKYLKGKPRANSAIYTQKYRRRLTT